MAPLKKSADEFIVPTLETSSQEYSSLVARRQELSELLSSLNREAADLDTKIAAQPQAAHSASVSRLLGDPEDAVPNLRKRRREVSGEITDCETALGVIAKRIVAARDVASKTACAAVRGEYGRRLGVLCEAAKALEAARAQHDSLLDDLEREDINLGYLRPVRAHFVEKVAYFLKECAEAGHNV
ncbi:chromosome segregation ATPase [Bradyrhizobium sp. CIR48]|uniref:hypothetical protein n=1 Tax=unclassified Bradyrhizobium TaxID=2631580 RepID=UPI0015CB8434|nr:MULTISPECIES: hypothetical protein [unclassified Bradyrhizobium]MBB4427989.1 chromosome segregation ATPase [Bradyrhizobium sp. CIR48]NYG49882.1 chromosome segregation ATPase [Bradyrhizobium sp. IAR9]